MAQKNLIKSESGASAVEFALLAPVFLLLCVGIIDFGMFTVDKMRAESTANAIADYVLNGGAEEDAIQDVVLAQYNMTPAEFEDDEDKFDVDSELVCRCADGEVVDCSAENSCNGIGDNSLWRYYDVTFTHRHDTLLPYQFIPETIELTGTAELRLD